MHIMSRLNRDDNLRTVGLLLRRLFDDAPALSVGGQREKTGGVRHENSFLESFGDALKAKFSLPGSASPEDQLKPVVADLLKSAGTDYGLTVDTRTETHLSDHKVRPDIAVYVGGLICGYVELKAPGLGADAPKLKGEHNSRQWEKLEKGLPNLIYTDGREWALYRGGERSDGQPIVRLHDDPTDKGKAATTKADAEGLERLFRDFLGCKRTYRITLPGLLITSPLLAASCGRRLKTRLVSPAPQSPCLPTNGASSSFRRRQREIRGRLRPNGHLCHAPRAPSGSGQLGSGGRRQDARENNGLLARTLELFGQAEARKELSVGFEMLQRSLEALDPHDFLKSKPDLWLYFYEDFLAAYDPKLRKDYGVYYTPREVVELQVRLASELLEKRFGKKLGFADDGVVFLDPAVGTGTYPVAAVKNGRKGSAKRSGNLRCLRARGRWPRTLTDLRCWSAPMLSLICG